MWKQTSGRESSATQRQSEADNRKVCLQGQQEEAPSLRFKSNEQRSDFCRTRAVDGKEGQPLDCYL